MATDEWRMIETEAEARMLAKPHGKPAKRNILQWGELPNLRRESLTENPKSIVATPPLSP